VAVTNAEAQIENTSICDKQVHIEALSSSIMTNWTIHEKERQTIKTICRNKGN